MKIIEWIKFCGENPIILGICSICGIAGFILTIVVTFKTSHISKVLKFNDTAELYNKQRKAYREKFEGHLASILKDDLKNNIVLKNILKDTTSYYEEFYGLLSFKQRIQFKLFFKLIKKDCSKVNFNKVTNFLTILTGRLAKKETKKNG